MANAQILADALAKLGKNGAKPTPTKKSSAKTRKGPTRDELRAAVKSIRSAKDDDEALDAWLRAHHMTAEYDPTED